MLKKTALAILAFLILFFGYVATRKGTFHYERSGSINAPRETIFPYLTHFKLGTEWSPYEKMDPEMKHTYGGVDGDVGAFEEFESKMAGSGRLEILKIVPNEEVQIRLHMTKPIEADNLVIYKLSLAEGGTTFTWSMSGDGGYMTKLMSVFIDCEKMVAGEFEKGIANLKTIAEAKANPKQGLNETPEVIEFPKSKYLYVEKVGPFSQTARAAWELVQKEIPNMAKLGLKVGSMALYKVGPQIYRAGIIVSEKPAQMPAGFQYTEFAGGKYSKFTVTGSYSQLPVVSGRVFELVKEKAIAVRDDFNIEHYVNDPMTTPEPQLITEIMVPTK